MLTVGEGDNSGEEEEESVPVCSMGRDASTDDVCADAAVAPLHDKPPGDDSPSQVSQQGCQFLLRKKLIVILTHF